MYLKGTCVPVRGGEKDRRESLNKSHAKKKTQLSVTHSFILSRKYVQVSNPSLKGCLRCVS